MNKLNKFEKLILMSALNQYEEKGEDAIKQMKQTSFFAPGYWKPIIKQIKGKLKLEIK